MAEKLFKQDAPPPGGYPRIKYARYLPVRGPHGVYVWAFATVVIGGGLYQVVQGIKRRNEEKYEIDRNYRALLPLLQAESDRDYVRRMRIANSEEARLTQHIEGWRVGQQAFKTRWAPPLFQP